MCSTSAVISGESIHTLELPYRRSLGPVVGAFLTGLRDRRVFGSRTTAGRVLVPPLEYDPVTGEAVETEMVEVGTAGVVTGWAWVEEPLRKHPFDHPFAWVMVQLDGADTSLVHALDVEAGTVSTGMRVQIRWAGERRGHIFDIACFVPEGGS